MLWKIICFGYSSKHIMVAWNKYLGVSSSANRQSIHVNTENTLNICSYECTWSTQNCWGWKICIEICTNIGLHVSTSYVDVYMMVHAFYPYIFIYKVCIRTRTFLDVHCIVHIQGNCTRNMHTHTSHLQWYPELCISCSFIASAEFKWKAPILKITRPQLRF